MPPRRSLFLSVFVDEIASLVLMSPFLTSLETSWLRSACRSCAGVFLSNMPESTLAFVYFEALASPDLAWKSFDLWSAEELDKGGFLARSLCFTEVPRLNRYSVLRVFRLRPCDAGCLGNYEPRRSEKLWRSKEFVLAAVEENGNALIFADESLRRDETVVLRAIDENAHALNYAHGSLRQNQMFLMEAVSRNGQVLRYADLAFRKDHDFVLAAVKQNALALYWADDTLKTDPDLVEAANAAFRRRFALTPQTTNNIQDHNYNQQEDKKKDRIISSSNKKKKNRCRRPLAK